MIHVGIVGEGSEGKGSPSPLPPTLRTATLILRQPPRVSGRAGEKIVGLDVVMLTSVWMSSGGCVCVCFGVRLHMYRCVSVVCPKPEGHSSGT